MPENSSNIYRSQAKHIKENYAQFKFNIKPDELKLFRDKCSENNTTATTEIKKFIKDYILKGVLTMVIYPAIFVQEDKGYYVYFQDLEGCQTEGENLEKAILMAQEALGLYIVSLQEREINVPKATNLKDVKINNNEFVSLISTDLKKFRRI